MSKIGLKLRDVTSDSERVQCDDDDEQVVHLEECTGGGAGARL